MSILSYLVRSTVTDVSYVSFTSSWPHLTLGFLVTFSSVNHMVTNTEVTGQLHTWQCLASCLFHFFHLCPEVFLLICRFEVPGNHSISIHVQPKSEPKIFLPFSTEWSVKEVSVYCLSEEGPIGLNNLWYLTLHELLGNVYSIHLSYSSLS